MISFIQEVLVSGILNKIEIPPSFLGTDEDTLFIRAKVNTWN